MNEMEYILHTNLVKLRIVKMVLLDVLPGKGTGMPTSIYMQLMGEINYRINLLEEIQPELKEK